MEIRSDVSPRSLPEALSEDLTTMDALGGGAIFSNGKASGRLVSQRQVFRDRKTDNQRSMVG